ncbi:MAG: AI-2E family transporter [Lachnospiraceae bacterium]|nr:AI-2E family transporter [Lachnospiraceae bacterium]
METEKRTKHKEFYRAQLLNDKRPFWKIAVSLLLSLLGTVLFIVLGLKFLVYFMPFVLGWFLAYIATPVVEWLERRLKIVKKIGSVLLIIGVLAAVIFLIYLIFSVLLKECATLIRDLPDMYGDLGKGIRTSAGGMDGILEKLPKQTRGSISTMFKDLDKTMGSVITDVSQPTVTAAGNFAKKIPSIIVGTIVTILSAYFFIAERENVIIWSKQVAPDPIVKRMSMVMSNLKYAVGGYLKAQFKIMGVVFATRSLWLRFLIVLPN